MKAHHAFLVIGIVLFTVGCSGQATEQVAQAEPTEVPPPPPVAVDPGPTLAVVEVLAEGSVYDPPVRVDQLPDGAWYCDMGTVHYARTDEGDGKCATCGMRLTHKQAHAGDETAAAPAG